MYDSYARQREALQNIIAGVQNGTIQQAAPQQVTPEMVAAINSRPQGNGWFDTSGNYRTDIRNNPELAGKLNYGEGPLIPGVPSNTGGQAGHGTAAQPGGTPAAGQPGFPGYNPGRGPTDPNYQGTPPANPGPGTPTVPPAGSTGVNPNGTPYTAGSTLGVGPKFPPPVPAGTPAGNLAQAYDKYLQGGGADLPLFHYTPGSPQMPSFNASAMLQEQRRRQGNTNVVQPYGGLPGSGTTLTPQTQAVLATLQQSGL